MWLPADILGCAPDGVLARPEHVFHYGGGSNASTAVSGNTGGDSSSSVGGGGVLVGQGGEYATSTGGGGGAAGLVRSKSKKKKKDGKKETKSSSVLGALNTIRSRTMSNIFGASSSSSSSPSPPTETYGSLLGGERVGGQARSGIPRSPSERRQIPQSGVQGVGAGAGREGERSLEAAASILSSSAPVSKTS